MALAKKLQEIELEVKNSKIDPFKAANKLFRNEEVITVHPRPGVFHAAQKMETPGV